VDSINEGEVAGSHVALLTAQAPRREVAETVFRLDRGRRVPEEARERRIVEPSLFEHPVVRKRFKAALQGVE